MRALVRFALVFTAMTGFGTAQPPEPRRPITEKDLLKFQWVADPEISPDGKQVAYVLVKVNEKEDRYETSVWAVDASGASAPRPLTLGPRDSAPRWSPDSRTLAFLRADEKEPPQIYLLSMEGGEGRKLTDLPKGASPAVWSPDGKTIAFTSATNEEDWKEKKQAKGEKEAAGKKSDVRVITRAVYRENGEGWLDPIHHQHIWTVPVALEGGSPAEAKEITTGKYDEEELFWSRDGSKIYFISDRVDEPYYVPQDSDVYAVPVKGGKLSTAIDIDGPIFAAAPSPDGRRFAFVGFANPPHIQSHTQPDIFSYVNGQATSLTGRYEFQVGSGIIGDQRPPRGGSPEPLVWTPDGRSVIAVATEHGRSNLLKIEVPSGRVEPLTTGNHGVICYTATPQASKIALTLSDPTHLGDLYVLETATKKLTRLTDVNGALFSQLELSEPEEIWYASFDGRKINGWLLKPPDFDPAKKYPLVLEIHGGPHIAYGYAFFHELQWMAAKGYVVLYVNPRGSTSYGREFTNIIQYKYPGDDYKDLMAGVDEALKRGYIDEQRLGVTGGSGGGLLTNWVVTQTPRFAAAVSQRSVADWAGFWYTADFALFLPFWFHSAPFHDPQEFLARSPVRYAERITTPLMLIVGDQDLRTPPGQGGEAMFRALKAQKKRTVMINFPGESHELSRSGKPSHRVERLEHILNWFDKYLQGKKIHLYDLQ
jgi:dipeptidyl aminopeptidase/acylaminoacyl peptidase